MKEPLFTNVEELTPNHVFSLLTGKSNLAVLGKKCPKKDNSSFITKCHLKRTKLTVLLKIYFDFVYFLCVSPVRFVQSQETGYFTEKTWLPQKILAGFLNLLGASMRVSTLHKIYTAFASTPDRNPKSYLQFFLRFAATVYKVYAVKLFWRHGNQHLQVLNYLATETNLEFGCASQQPVQFWIMTPYFAYTLYGAVLAVVGFAVAIGHGMVVPFSSWTPEWWLRCLAGVARLTFYSENHLNSTTEVPTLSELSSEDWGITMLMLLGYFQQYVYGFFLDLGLLASALTLYTTANLLEKDIKKAFKFEIEHNHQMSVQGLQGKIVSHPGKGLTWSSVYKRFQAIQNLSDKINTALGSQVALYLAEGIIYYSINLSFIIVAKDPYEKFQQTVPFLIMVSILKSAADIESHMSSVKLWLRKSIHRQQTPLVEVSLVLHELASNEIGLKGSGMFTVTYALLGGLLGLVITLFMLTLQ